MVLRKYLYIDEDFVNDAFATINGYDYNSKDITNTETASVRDGSGVENCTEQSATTGTAINANMTMVAKLQSVIDYLNQTNGGSLPYIESADEATISSFRRESFFEGCFKLSFTKIENYGNLIEGAQKLEKLMGTHKLDDTDGIEQMVQLAKQEREKGTPCTLTFINDGAPKVYAYLNEAYLKPNSKHLLRDVTILCKVVRTIRKGDTVCLTDLTEYINMTFPNTPKGKKERVEAIKSGRMRKIKDFEDKISGPAIEILPIAIYR